MFKNIKKLIENKVLFHIIIVLIIKIIVIYALYNAFFKDNKVVFNSHIVKERI